MGASQSLTTRCDGNNAETGYTPPPKMPMVETMESKAYRKVRLLQWTYIVLLWKYFDASSTITNSVFIPSLFKISLRNNRWFRLGAWQRPTFWCRALKAFSNAIPCEVKR